MSDSTNRIAAITGGASGIGLAFAELWVSQGGRVVLLDMNAEAIDSAVESLGGEAKARGVVTDVTDNDSVVAAFESIRLNEETLHVGVNCAGMVSVTEVTVPTLVFIMSMPFRSRVPPRFSDFQSLTQSMPLTA